MKLIAAVAAMAITLSLSAQDSKPFSKGTFMVGGTAGFSSQSRNDIDVFSMGFNPVLGYYIIDNLALGIIPSLNYSKTKVDVNLINSEENLLVLKTLKYKTTTYLIEPFARYSAKNGLFVQLQGGFGKAIYKNDGKKDKINTRRIMPSVGYSYFVTPNVVLEGSVYYCFTKEEPDVAQIKDAKNKEFGMRFGFQIYL